MSGPPISPAGSPAITQAVPRRLVLRAGAVAALGSVLLTGCDLDPRSPDSSPTAAATPDPDQHVVEAARAELRGLLLRLAVTSGAGALVACHRTQLAALEGDPPPTTQRARPFTPAQTVARERRAAQRFERWALTCQNGDLARVLASVSAGIRTQPVLRERSS